MAQLFGFTIQKTKEIQNPYTVPDYTDGSTVVDGGAYGTYVDLDGTFKNEMELIGKYREMSLNPEVDAAIDDILNESLIYGEQDPPVKMDFQNNTDYSDKLKKTIFKEFDGILDILKFNSEGPRIFRRWYVDGKLYYHKIIDPDKPKKGITELKYIDPRRLRKVRELLKESNQITPAGETLKPKSTTKKSNGSGDGPPEVREFKPDNSSTNGKNGSGSQLKMRADHPKFKPLKYREYYIYNKGDLKNKTGWTQGIKITADEIATSNSGLLDYNANMIVSNLHKAIKPLNQLKMMEDSLVIYRLSRAPERRIFYIDVGNLPKAKAEQYLRDVMNKYRNKVVYDSNTGEIRDDKKHMTMMEDYWLPRREGGRGTEISTLPGGMNLGELEDIKYFQRKLYHSLNVPVSRLEQRDGMILGRAAEITRDELKFAKFVTRIRNEFAELFYDLLKTQLILKNIIKPEEWKSLRQQLKMIFADETFYKEDKLFEGFRNRIMMLRDMEDYIGRYFSINFVRKHVLKQTDEEIELMNNEINKEKELESGGGENVIGPGIGPKVNPAAYGLDPSALPEKDLPSTDVVSQIPPNVLTQLQKAGIDPTQLSPEDLQQIMSAA